MEGSSSFERLQDNGWMKTAVDDVDKNCKQSIQAV